MESIRIQMEKQTKSSFFHIKISQKVRKGSVLKPPEDPSLPRTCAMELDTGVCVGSFSLPE